MTDRAFLLEVLADGQEHELSEIIRRSQDERGFGLTVHSRVAELRPLLEPEGKTIVQRSGRAGGRARSFYRLVSLTASESHSSIGAGGGGSDAVNDGELPHGSAPDSPSAVAAGVELPLFTLDEPAPGAYSEAA